MKKSLRRILCIDDENDIIQVATLALEHVGGYEVFSCLSGKQALERVEDINPDLILLDAMMPQMDGPATLRELHKQQAWKVIPIVFMTARVQPKEVEEYLQMGASGVISKPFDPMTLSQEIARQWEKFHAGRKAALEALMAPLREEYLAQVKDVLLMLESAVPKLEANALSPDERLVLANKAHSLCGSGATYGFEVITTTGRGLEMALKEKENPPGPKQITDLLKALIAACGDALAKPAQAGVEQTAAAS